MAGMTKIAPIRANATAMRVVIPKSAMTGNVARQSAENPKKVVRPETVIATDCRLLHDLLYGRQRSNPGAQFLIVQSYLIICKYNLLLGK